MVQNKLANDIICAHYIGNTRAQNTNQLFQLFQNVPSRNRSHNIMFTLWSNLRYFVGIKILIDRVNGSYNVRVQERYVDVKAGVTTHLRVRIGRHVQLYYAFRKVLCQRRVGKSLGMFVTKNFFMYIFTDVCTYLLCLESNETRFVINKISS